MKKKTLFNIKGAGRPAIHDRGVRHIARDEIKRLTVLHLTVKVEKAKAGLKNKQVLRVLRKAICKARVIGLNIVHYTLEYDHVHMMVEVDDNETLGRGMQSFGISLSKGINKLKSATGKVFKTRYHFRKLKTPTEVKNALTYILGNAVKHKSSTLLNEYNSLLMLEDFSILFPKLRIRFDSTLKRWRDELLLTLGDPESALLRQFV